MARVQRLVTDPLVRFLPGLLSNPGGASGIEAALVEVRSAVADGHPDRARRALHDLEAAAATYAGSSGFREADRVVLQALDIVRIRVEMLLLDAVPVASRAASSE